MITNFGRKHEEELATRWKIEKSDLESLLQREPSVLWIKGREHLILSLYYGICGEEQHTLEEIGRFYGVTRERINQVRCKVMECIADQLQVPAQSNSPDAFAENVLTYDLGTAVGLKRRLIQETRKRLRGMTIGEFVTTPPSRLLQRQRITRDVIDAAERMLARASKP
ncbi:MAG TPA: sigma factor-like helix-turn-helix DNA-binding protein [Candidatus Paceibacterota bacterium]